MQSTKDNILAYLKRSGGAGVEAVASEFGLARMTVRQHLSGLERDRLVISREERGRTGRPHLLFTLTDEGEERFPKRYDRLADLALLGKLLGQDTRCDQFISQGADSCRFIVKVDATSDDKAK